MVPPNLFGEIWSKWTFLLLFLRWRGLINNYLFPIKSCQEIWTVISWYLELNCHDSRKWFQSFIHVYKCIVEYYISDIACSSFEDRWTKAFAKHHKAVKRPHHGSGADQGGNGWKQQRHLQLFFPLVLPAAVILCWGGESQRAAQ